MSRFLPPFPPVRLAAALLASAPALRAAPSAAGRPVIENFSTAEIGVDADCWNVLPDADGRMLVGTDGLAVFDGTGWRVVPVPGSAPLRALAVGPDGRIWAGGVNEVGYFSPGSAPVYHSLDARLPAGTGDLGGVWSAFARGDEVVFATQDRLLAWNGESFRCFSLPGGRRVFGSRSGDRLFFYHSLTGLYEYAGGELRLIATRQALGGADVLWVEAQPDGYLLGGSSGFLRYAEGRLSPFAPEASAYVRDNRLTSAVRLRDGTLAAGTYYGGLALIDPAGRLLRVLSQAQGLPNRAVYSLCLDREGSLWAALGGYVSRIDFDAGVSIFDGRNGFAARPVSGLFMGAEDLLACTDDGLFRLRQDGGPAEVPAEDGRSRHHYWAVTEVGGRTLGARFRGIDDLESGRAGEIWSTIHDVFALAASPRSPGRFWAADGAEVQEIAWTPGRPASARSIATLPDAAASLCVGDDGSVWAGTTTRGLFRLRPDGRGGYRRGAVGPAEGFSGAGGSVSVARIGGGVFALAADGIYRLRPGAERMERLAAFPAGRPKALAALPDGAGAYVVFERDPGSGASRPGLGFLGGLASEAPAWREFSLAGAGDIGHVRCAALGRGAGAHLLWIGGTEGMLRVDCDALGEVSAPPRPVVDRLGPAGADEADRREFSHEENRLAAHFYSPGFRHRDQWLYQTRLAGPDANWSRPSPGAGQELSYLREGSYVLEVRAVNEAGMASATAYEGFRILPPWYRTLWAYLAYAGAGVAAVVAFGRWRHRTMLRQNRELAQLVRDRTRELEKAGAAKDEFIASISHEIRNPLNGVIGLALALDAAELPAAQRRQLGMIRQCADHLSALIEEILDFSRIEAGEIEIVPRPFRVAELLESVRAVLYEQSLASGLPLDLDLHPSVPPVLVGDKHRIRQILVNFVGNALKYAGRGRIRMSVRAALIEELRHDVTFTVSDQGPGIPASEQAQLFSKFKRGSAARVRNVGGAGLGLAVCRSLAERMGGTTSVESEVGSGASFHLRLSLEARPEEPREAAPEAGTPAFEMPVSALVVEDQEFNSASMVAMLERMGIATAVAASAEEALARLAERSPELIFVDCDLPDMSGFELAALIRRRESPERRALIVATTAHATAHQRQACLAAGMDAFVGKPITLEKLRAAIAGPLSAGRTAPPVGLAETEEPIIPEFRLDTLRYITKGDPTEFARRLQTFVRELDGYAEEIAAAVHTARLDPARRLAHKMVSHLSVVEHERLSLIAQQIEEAAVNRDLPEAAARLSELRAGVRDFKRSLAALSPGDGD